MKKYWTLAFLLAASPAAAQQPSQLSPTNIAIQINNAVNQMALELEQDRQTIQNLQKALVDAQAKLKEPAPKNDGQK